MKKIIAIIFIMGFVAYSNAQQEGCTDSLALNYNAENTIDDGSCTYQTLSVGPVVSNNLPDVMNETSGIIIWENRIWTHNDSGDTNLYAFNADDPENYETYPLPGVVNNDWEDIAQDSLYIYIGDVGNNGNGNRRNLKILRIEKQSLLQKIPIIDTIHFSYELQDDFTATGSNKTDFDCEAFVITDDSIYLFTKEWISKKTSLYALPKTPGEYVAQYRSSFNVNGLITGATYLKEKNLLTLCGYSSNYTQSFVYLFYDFSSTDFFDGHQRKVFTTLFAYQIEGIDSDDGITYYMTNENVNQSLLKVKQKIHTFNLSGAFIAPNDETSITEIIPKEKIIISPIPANHDITITVDNDLLGERYHIRNILGHELLNGILQKVTTTIDIQQFVPGIYFLSIEGKKPLTQKWVKSN